MYTEVNKREVLIDDIAYSGSAFGITVDKGEGVFINQRIVESVKVKPGDRVMAFVLPNYEDKRATIPWRAMRVEVLGSIFDDVSDEHFENDEEVIEEQRIEELIVQKLDEVGPMRTATLARLVGRTAGEVQTLCLGLWAAKRIAMADVFKDPSQKRSSHRVWAVSINDFDVEPFEEEGMI